MLKLPLLIVYAVIAFNITLFALMLQMDLLIFNSVIAKAVAWVLAAGAWWLAYVNRNKHIKLF